MLLFLYGAHHTVTNPDKHWLEWKSVTINPVDYFRLILHWKALNLYLALALQYTSQFVYSLMVLYMPRFFTEHQSQNTPAKYDLECLTQRAFRLIVLPASYESYNYPILLEGNILI